MEQFEINGHAYRADKLNAIDQFNVSRRLTPVVLSLAPLIGVGVTSEEIAAVITSDIGKNASILEPTVLAVSKMSDDDVNYVIAKTLSKVYRGSKDPVTEAVVAWSQVWGRGGLQFEDMDMVEMIRIIWMVLSSQFQGFFSESQSGSTG